MAVSVVADNDRVAVATSATDAGTWGNDGGGGGVADEPDFVYQGGSSQSRKVSTTRIGRQYLGGTTRDASGAGSYTTFLFKVLVSNYGVLLLRTAPALGIKIGSSASAYDEWYIFGNDNYPIVGGWQFVAIDPNVAGYVDGGAGTPAFTAVDYYSLIGDFSSGSKSENLVIDAIDLGRGMVLYGGTPDGVFADFLNGDEGTSANRYGYIRSLDGIYFCQGRLAIGEDAAGASASTQFTDITAQVLVWENGMTATGYYGMRFNLGNASTTIDISDATFDSIGEKNNTAERSYETAEDTRLDVQVSGSSGTLDLTNCLFKNLQDFVMTSAVTFIGGAIETFEMTQANALVKDCRIVTTSRSSEHTIQDPTFPSPSTDDENLHDIEFVQNHHAGSAYGGNAMEIGSTGTYEFVGLLFSGYSNTSATGVTFNTTTDINATNDTINLTGADAAGVKNGDPMVVNANGGAATPGLTAGTTYYVQAATGTDNYTFHTTEAAAINTGSTPIALASGGAETWYVEDWGQALYINVASGTVTINVTGGGEAPTYRLPIGSTATVIINVDPVTTLIRVKDTGGTVIQSARVYLVAADGTGDLPFELEVTTLTRTGTTATATTVGAHGLVDGDWMVIRGADQEEYNVAATVAVGSTTQFDYSMTNDPGADATGVITVTGGIFNTLTNASGEVSDIRTWTVDQNVVGWIRKSTTSPFYKQTALSGTISSTGGLTIEAQMLSDE